MGRSLKEPEPRAWILVILICIGMVYLCFLQEMGKLKPFQPEDYASSYADGWQGRIDSEKRMDCVNTGIRALTGFDPDHPSSADVGYKIYHDCLNSAGLK